MGYATQQDLIDRFGERELLELTDRAEPPAEGIDPTIVARALADADEAIDGYVRARYQVPLSPVPGTINRIACDIARYLLHRDAAPDEVRRRYEDGLAQLRAIAAGTVKLLAAGVEATAPPAGEILVSAPDRTFTKDTLADFG